MLGYKWIPEKADFIANMRLNFLKSAMQKGYDIVVDNMNLDPKHLEFIRKLVNTYNSLSSSKRVYIIAIKDFFDISLEECIERNSKRENPIGEEVITETYDRYKDIIEKLKK